MTEQDQQEKILLDVASTPAVEKSPSSSSTSCCKQIYDRLHERSGIFYILTANIIFACCTFALKLIPTDMFDIMIVRFLIQAVVFGSYARFYKHYDVFGTNGQPLASALNVIMSSGTNLTYLAAFYFLPLSDLNTIKYTYIVWAAILSVIFLKDRFTFINGISLLLALVGLIFATKAEFFLRTLNQFSNSTASLTNATIPSTAEADSPYYYLGLTFALLSSITKAIQMIARKQLVSRKQPYSVMNFQFTALALFVSISYSLIRRYWQPGPYPWKWMGTAGVVIGCCQLLTNTFYAKALKRENVQLLSIIGTLDILYAVLLQYIFFRQTKSWLFYVGASLVVLAAIILSVDSHQQSKEQKKKAQMLESQNGKTHV